MEHHSKVSFENSYNSLPETFFKRVKPEKMPDVSLFLVNQKLSEKLNLDYSWSVSYTHLTLPTNREV